MIAVVNDCPKAAIVLFNNNNNDFLVMNLWTTVSVMIINVVILGKSYIFGSIYCSPSMELLSVCREVEEVLQIRSNSYCVLGGDYNAKSHIWGDKSQDNRGQILIDMFQTLDMVVLNDPNSIPTFQGAQGSSWIDVTATFDSNIIEDWQVMTEVSLSDHKYIDFNVVLCKLGAVYKKSSYYFKNLNLLDFYEALNREFNCVNINMFDGDVSDIIMEITQKLHSICERCTIKKIPKYGNSLVE